MARIPAPFRSSNMSGGFQVRQGRPGSDGGPCLASAHTSPLHSSCSTRTLLPRGEAYPPSPHPLLVSLEPTRRCCPLRPDRVFFLPPAANHTILALGLQEDGDAGNQVKSRKCGGVIVPLLVAMYEVRQSIVGRSLSTCLDLSTLEIVLFASFFFLGNAFLSCTEPLPLAVHTAQARPPGAAGFFPYLCLLPAQSS